jgi:hypothetical protein
MPVLLEVLGFVLFGAATFLYLNARETARENLRLQKLSKAQAERLTAVEMRLRRLEATLYDLATANGAAYPAAAEAAGANGDATATARAR